MRLSLEYDAGLTRVNTWRLAVEAHCVFARVRVASALECRIMVPLRRSPTVGRGDERRFVRCLDGVTWLVESALHHADMPRVELALRGTPEHVSAYLRQVP